MVGCSNPPGPTDLTLFMKKISLFSKKAGYFDSKIVHVKIWYTFNQKLYNILEL
jgi:hypothetical protein